MPTIRIPRLRKEWDVPAGTRLYDALRTAEVPIASSCLGELVCNRCKVKILQGAENLSPPSERELKLAHRMEWEIDLKQPWRAACGATILYGEVELWTSYW